MSFYFIFLFTFLLSCNEVGGNTIIKMKPNYHMRSVEGLERLKKTSLKRDNYPFRTIPTRRFDNGASERASFISFNEPSGTYLAGVRTKRGSARYSGGGMTLSVYNPRTRPGAYSQARLKISNGPDAIQVGWRVDPSLRGDNLTRIFIYTETSLTSCFDAKCGFVIVNTTFILDDYIKPVSQTGILPQYEYKFYIIRTLAYDWTCFNTHDQSSGNWWLMCGFAENKVGYWPKNIFTGLQDLATTVEWAGEVYSPPGVFEPLMGSGYRPSVGDTLYVAYFRFMQVLDENNTYLDAKKLEEFATDRSLYDVKDEGNVGDDYFKQLVLYGGARY